jgi:hypothetical protein
MTAIEQHAVKQNMPERAALAHPDPEPRLESEAVWDDAQRWAAIAENAYYRAERRGFVPGYDFEDWLAAEQEIAKRVY